MTTANWVALILLIVGGLNWGLVGLFNFDLVAAIFGEMSVLSRLVYIVVGIAAVYAAVVSPRLAPPASHHAGIRTH
ncbi:DUF378 domain-containing protein [Alkalilimnicola ehrlichii]|uniref:DUF378 domain-containing protein n=1 Tax=Alkalilimnicola ehrlichii TaxID=351052 RepID=A0A3E0WXU7_9GAMM|nr:DUF378 domain-containing protein [Alkalilimnicola ehrlichii]RFA29331.1 DUF378 domain-containing protein [Alkalilimnicola ehrlichii]RFA36846.1 DUF378 domain-containing protein [Alkalilimnicola ehrlichii]